MERMSPQPISEAARRRFEELVPTAPNVELRAMFGTLAALVDGHVFALLMGERIGVKAGPDGLAELASLPGSDVLSMGARTCGRTARCPTISATTSAGPGSSAPEPTSPAFHTRPRGGAVAVSPPPDGSHHPPIAAPVWSRA